MSHNPIRPWRNIDRRKTRQIHVGPVAVGGDAPITVQTMTNTLTTDVKATVEQVQACAEAGADIVRISVPDAASATALKEIVRESPVPIVADIHFHYKRGIEAAEAGAACLRINPGNIGDEKRVKEVIKAARDHDCSIRIGVNAGSLEKHLLDKYGEPCPDAMVESGMDHIKILEDNDFLNFKDFHEGLGRLHDGRGLPDAGRTDRRAVPPRHHRGGRLCRRHGEIRDRAGQPALVWAGRHDACFRCRRTPWKR